MRQLVPSHFSASVNGPESVRCSPTAVQAWALHATPLKKFSAPESFGVGWMRHAVPSHRSASVPASEPPTAVHAEDDVQDTAERPAPAAGLGVRWMRQRVPFHRSASVPIGLPEASVRAPTAVQTEGDVHATPLRKPPGDEGAGTGWIRHFVPFHRSAKTPTGVPELLKEFPVAVQADDDVQDKPNKALPGAPGGLGVGWMRHRLPSHRSAKVRRMPDLPTENPAAVQAEEAVQSTPISKLSPAARLGVGWLRHRLPSHRSAKVRGMPDLPTENPAAVQAEDDGQATAFSKANCAPAGLGVRWMRHRVPFHHSASVLPAFDLPAAVQAEGDVQDTPFRLPPPCAGLGVGWMRHRVPFHRSASVPTFQPPTAVDADGDVHDTLFRLQAPWLGLGVGWMRHRVPSQRSARGWNEPARVMLAPTAVHADGAVQETPDRELTAAPRGLGVGWMRHVLPFHRSARVTPTPEALTYVPTAVHEVAPVQDSQ